MISFANAKINIGLQVLGRRPDGYHNLETVFYPVQLNDVLEIVEGEQTKLISSGLEIPGNGNLCLEAYEMLATDHKLPPLQIYLHKVIPIGAGLGGGSADAAFLLNLINNKYELGLQEDTLMAYARRLGADCAFFIHNKPVLARGIGDELSDIPLDLSAYKIVLVKPNIHISTAMAYRSVVQYTQEQRLEAYILQPVTEWKATISNDFESGIFNQFPQIYGIKAALYEAGALYASMSGSGSSVYGIFAEEVKLPELEVQHQVYYLD
ncbi:4-diphosphocytidyl-2-C-methyl-D-erythritol kinase [bacterium A37T11]|nr:4-diphosphocytidyl-2-C-methyl-D-erythritol kinase [bacterium A37T11]